MPNARPEDTPSPALVERFRSALDAEHQDRIGLAVSGGPDSLALLLLAHAACPGRIEAATVDHGLRRESMAEATAVGAICAALGVAHQILRGDWSPNAGDGMQAEARRHRYALLTAWCADRGLTRLATGHHADDQAETLLLRIARGAGLRGLASIRKARDLGGGIRLVRPLLGFTKLELGALLAEAGIEAADDPSNRHERFDRTRARRLLQHTEWLRADRLAAVASHLADAEEALDWAARAEWDRRAHIRESGASDFDPAGLPPEFLRRMVEIAILRAEEAVTHGSPDPHYTGPELSRFIARLARGQAATLAHVRATGGPTWRFGPAPPRRG